MITGSKKQLLDLIKKRGILSIDEAVKEMGLAKTTLREHFLQLERDGLIDRDYVRSGPGRPSLQYELTPEGNRLFPSQESVLIRQLLAWLTSQDQQETIEAFFENFWEERLQKARHLMDAASPTDLPARLAALKGWLKEEGFMPEIELDPNQKNIIIKECNCPFSEVVKETRLPCRLEANFYEQLFDGPADRTSFIAEGDFACTYSISLNPQEENVSE